MAGMDARVQDILNGKGKDYRDSLRYYIESSHDTQLGNILEWLNPIDFTFEDIPYSSSIFFELFYDEQCVATQKYLP